MYSIVIPSIISCDSSSAEVGFNGILLGGGVVDKNRQMKFGVSGGHI